MTNSNIPDWVAPEGEHLRFPLGSKVRFDHILDEHCNLTGPLWRGWKRVSIEPTEGFVVGLRFPYSGTYSPARLTPSTSFGPEEYSPAYRTHEVVHRAYLVAYDARKAPVYVLAEDLQEVPNETD